EDDGQALGGLLRGHDCGTSLATSTFEVCTAAGVGFVPDSFSSLANSTNAAPTPTRMTPATSFQPGNSKLKFAQLPAFGCQTMLTSTLMTGARPKISGAMYTL